MVRRWGRRRYAKRIHMCRFVSAIKDHVPMTKSYCRQRVDGGRDQGEVRAHILLARSRPVAGEEHHTTISRVEAIVDSEGCGHIHEDRHASGPVVWPVHRCRHRRIEWRVRVDGEYVSHSAYTKS
jgi:hypothetical protein